MRMGRRGGDAKKEIPLPQNMNGKAGRPPLRSHCMQLCSKQRSVSAHRGVEAYNEICTVAHTTKLQVKRHLSRTPPAREQNDMNTCVL